MRNRFLYFFKLHNVKSVLKKDPNVGIFDIFKIYFHQLFDAFIEVDKIKDLILVKGWRMSASKRLISRSPGRFDNVNLRVFALAKQAEGLH